MKNSLNFDKFPIKQDFLYIIFAFIFKNFKTFALETKTKTLFTVWPEDTVKMISIF